MPSRAVIEAAIEELALQGLSVSVEHIRGLTGGSPRNICRILREIRTPLAAPPPPPPLTLEGVRTAARQVIMLRQDPHPLVTLDHLNGALDRSHRYSVEDLWLALLPACTDAGDRSAIDWKIQTTRGKLIWTSGEPKRLDQLWARLVIGPIGRINPQERAAYEAELWGKLAQQRRQAEELARRRQLQ